MYVNIHRVLKYLPYIASQLLATLTLASQLLMKFEFIKEQQSTVSSCLIRLNQQTNRQLFIDSLASQPKLNHVFKSFVSYKRQVNLMILTVLTYFKANLLQSILQLSIQKKWKLITLAHQQEMFFLWYPFYLGLGTFGQGPTISVVTI